MIKIKTRYFIPVFLLTQLAASSIATAADKAASEDTEEPTALPETPAAPAGTLSLARPNHRFFNVRLTAGADFALGNDLESRGLGEVGGQGAIGVDWVIVEPLAFSILVGYSAFASGDDGALQDLFATVGFQLRLFPDKKGALGQPGGNAAGHLFLDAHFGYHGYENQEHAGYNVGLGYELSLAKDFNLGPYVRFAHTPIGDGFSYFSVAFGLQASVGGKFKTDDADSDTVEDDDDKCPLIAEDKDNFEDEDGCPDEDNDEDGIPDLDDECPDQAGVASNKGCEENDNDHDGILNDNDECPDQAEDKDTFEDKDGCPDDDNDNDGIPDSQDQCPLKPEDSDGYEDDDGCPDKDNDSDGIRDIRDKCPLIPENKNDIEDTDGCPDFARLEETKIALLDRVYFDKGKSVIQERSMAMLKEAAGILLLRADLNIRIEGHTDNWGGKKKNLALSKARAESVKAFLEAEGVGPERLEAVGLGQEKPVADNATKAGRERNERIELHIKGAQAEAPEEDEGAVDAPEPPPEHATAPTAATVDDEKTE